MAFSARMTEAQAEARWEALPARFDWAVKAEEDRAAEVWRSRRARGRPLCLAPRVNRSCIVRTIDLLTFPGAQCAL